MICWLCFAIVNAWDIMNPELSMQGRFSAFPANSNSVFLFMGSKHKVLFVFFLLGFRNWILKLAAALNHCEIFFSISLHSCYVWLKHEFVLLQETFVSSLKKHAAILNWNFIIFLEDELLGGSDFISKLCFSIISPKFFCNET